MPDKVNPTRCEALVVDPKEMVKPYVAADGVSLAAR